MANENVNIVLTAQDKTKQAFQGVRKGLDRVKDAVFSVKGALVSLGATAVFAKMSSDIDSLGKTSAKLGVVASELQALRYAANLSGVETNTLDMAFQRFTRRLAEARNGMGEAKAALEEMNIQLKNADGSARTQMEVLNDVADAFVKIKDPADRVRLAFKLFDAEGVSMVNMLGQGSKALKEVTDRFDQLGTALSDEQIKRVENMNDRFTTMGAIFESLGQKIYLNMILPLMDLSTRVFATYLRGEALFLQAQQDIINSFKEAYNWVTKYSGGLLEAVEMTDYSEGVKYWNDMADALEETGKQATKTGKAIADISKPKPTGINVEAPVGEAIKTTIEPVKEATNQLEEYAKVAGYTNENMQNMAMNGLQSIEDGFVGLISGTKSVKDAFGDMARSVISDLIRMSIQQSITAPLAGMMSGFFGGGAQPISVGQATGAATLPSWNPPLAGTRALGGSVSAGQAYTVGEQGREMFIPNADGQIVPNGKLGGSDNINVTLNISTGVSQTVRAEITNLLPQITNAAKSAVADARQRGGSYSKAMGV